QGEAGLIRQSSPNVGGDERAAGALPTHLDIAGVGNGGGKLGGSRRRVARRRSRIRHRDTRKDVKIVVVVHFGLGLDLLDIAASQSEESVGRVVPALGSGVGLLLRIEMSLISRLGGVHGGGEVGDLS